jgi:HEPN domain-containing protein
MSAEEAGHQAVALWLARADDDRRAVAVLIAHPDPPLGIVCYHCQQYAEKLLKAPLTARSLERPKTHHLGRLILLLKETDGDLMDLLDDSDALTAHAAASRYPHDWVALEPRDTARSRIASRP